MLKKILLTIAVFFVVATFTVHSHTNKKQVISHSAPTDPDGCHYHPKWGGYHCH